MSVIFTALEQKRKIVDIERKEHIMKLTSLVKIGFGIGLGFILNACGAKDSSSSIKGGGGVPTRVASPIYVCTSTKVEGYSNNRILGTTSDEIKLTVYGQDRKLSVEYKGPVPLKATNGSVKMDVLGRTITISEPTHPRSSLMGRIDELSAGPVEDRFFAQVQAPLTNRKAPRQGYLEYKVGMSFAVFADLLCIVK